MHERIEEAARYDSNTRRALLAREAREKLLAEGIQFDLALT
jgi:hypothetical protein